MPFRLPDAQRRTPFVGSRNKDPSKTARKSLRLYCHKEGENK